MRIVEIPVLGRPLVGKTTVLLRAREVFGGHLQLLEFRLEVDDAFRGQSCRLAALHVQTESAHGQLWCVPGGSAPEWIVPLLPQDSPAVFVFDGQEGLQAEQREWFDAQAPHVDLSRSVAIVTKADLPRCVSPEEAIPPALRDRPFISIVARDPRCAAQVHRLLAENFDAFVRPANARPLQERAAWTGL
ncbi:MAG TPA: hypothetical protein VF432_01175 [Thermoanaerobaculia bacterium]